MAGVRAMGSSLTLIKAGSEAADVEFASLTSIGAVEGEREEIDVTTLDSANGAKEFISGAADFGSVEMAMNVTTSNQSQITKIDALFDSGAIRSWEIEDATGTLAFTGYVSAVSYGEKTTDGMVAYNFTIRVSGKPTFTPTAVSA